MSQTNVKETYDSLMESMSLPAEDVNKKAKTLLEEAPDTESLPQRRRLEAILVHNNISREVYDLILKTSSPETLTSDEGSVLHLMLSSPVATTEDVKKLKSFAGNSGNAEWFNLTVEVTTKSFENMLNLSYHGQQVVAEEEERENMQRTLNILKEALA